MKKTLTRRAQNQKGFTLVELLIVLAILAVLAAVVIPNVTGMFGRGAQQAWETDVKTIQTATATYYFDIHDLDPWITDENKDGHWYPLAAGDQVLTLNVNLTAPAIIKKQTVYPVTSAGAFVTDEAATSITAAAIWMGLMVNTPGMTGTLETPGQSSVLLTEKGPYLNELPKSASSNNITPSTPAGSYTWVIGQDGKVYGITFITPDSGGAEGWYAGFNGTYP